MLHRCLLLGVCVAWLLAATGCTASGNKANLRVMPAVTRQAQPLPDAVAGGRTVMINGAQIYYRVTGEGPPLVLIHGYPLSGRLFARQHQELSDRFKVITLDLRGYGRSKTPSNNATIQTYATDVLSLLDMLGVKQAIIGGHSMGGIIALEMYQQAPQRFAGMILIDTIAAPASIIGEHIWRGFAAQAQAKGMASLTSKFIPQLLTGQTRLHNKELVNYLKSIIKEASVPAAVAGGHALAGRPSYTNMLGSISVPALILVGMEDTVTPIAIAKSLHKAIPESQLVIIEDGSHAVIIEQAEQANQAIQRWFDQAVVRNVARNVR